MARSYQDLLAYAREQVPEVQVADLAARRAAGDAPLVWTSASSASGTRAASPARSSSRGATSRAGSPASRRRPGDRAELCVRPPLAARRHDAPGDGLRQDVEPRRGVPRWKQSGQDWDVPRTLTPDQRSRYSRHTLIPEVGEEGQLKLLGAKALLIGAGGLGAPAALYLAAAGVGTIGLVDDDVVDASNLQRQIIHTTDRRGHAQGRVGARSRSRRSTPTSRSTSPVPGWTPSNVLDLLSQTTT